MKERVLVYCCSLHISDVAILAEVTKNFKTPHKTSFEIFNINIGGV